MISLPLHCTHALQPLDRTVFGPFKYVYNEYCSDFLIEHLFLVVHRCTFPTLLKNAWEKALSVDNIKNGFRAFGIVPFNTNAITLSAYGSSKPTDVPMTQNGQALVDITDTEEAVSKLLVSSEDPLLSATPLFDDSLVEDLTSVLDSIGETLDAPHISCPQPSTDGGIIIPGSTLCRRSRRPSRPVQPLSFCL